MQTMLQKPRNVLALALVAAFPALGWSQTSSSKPAAAGNEHPELATIEVKGQAMADASAAYSTTTIENAQIKDLHISETKELFRHVPGMNVQNYQLPGVADGIVMRGFGGGGHGGDIGAVLDGIPLNEAMSHADGYVDFNVIIPLEIDRLTVYKGPVSPLYGNFNRAGLVAINTRKGGVYNDLDLRLGSHSTFDGQWALGRQLENGDDINFAAQHARSNGFRPQSDAERSTVSGRWRHSLTSDLEVVLSGRLHHANGNSASYITESQLKTDPYGIDPRTQNDGSKKNFGTLRADVNYTLSPKVKLLSFAYLTRQDFTRWFTRPTSSGWKQREESYDRTVFGAGTSLNGHSDVAGQHVNWVLGLETFRESTDYEYYDGTNNRIRTSPAINDRQSKLNSLSAFGELEVPLHRLFTPTLGMRWDRFSGGCKLLGPETGTDPCGPLAKMSHASPKVGVKSEVLPGVLQLRASWAEGFALPSTFAKYALGATAVSPNVFKQTEIGAQLTPLQGVFLDIAAYRLNSSDEIRAVAPGVYENYGATRRTGIEASALWSVHRTLDLAMTYGSANSKVTENGTASLVGNRVAGVPKYTGTVSATWKPLAQWAATVTYRKVGNYAVDAANTVTYGGYNTWDLGVSYTARGSQNYRVYAQIANLADKAYATTASVIGGTRLYAPGAPRTLSAGVQYQF